MPDLVAPRTGPASSYPIFGTRSTGDDVAGLPCTCAFSASVAFTQSELALCAVTSAGTREEYWESDVRLPCCTNALPPSPLHPLSPSPTSHSSNVTLICEKATCTHAPPACGAGMSSAAHAARTSTLPLQRRALSSAGFACRLDAGIASAARRVFRTGCHKAPVRGPLPALSS